ncbi:SulP family inorganic anion transporter [Pseudonocardia zijingensis]|uniref:SLC26A/SulP transporter domain-containing protein n=1 Tax=Pseudonocardia zijingensis TaxID=153376 RepID=A0ABP3ZKA4_9PSEU
MSHPGLRTFRSALLRLSPRALRTEVLAGIVVALALIPEAIAFSLIAGVDPRVGLFASFTMAVTISLTVGRPAMISAATGAIALVVAPLARSHGLDHLIAAVILGGVFQIGLAAAGVARLMRFLPRSVMVGFVNALAILIFGSQLPHLVDVPWAAYPLVVAGLAVIVGFPRLTRGGPGAAGGDHGPDRVHRGRGGRGADGGRPGGAARQPARDRPARGAAVAVMIMVAVGTFDWHSLRTPGRMPRSETTVMLSTVAVTVATHSLAIGVGVGVLVAMVLFACRVAHLVDVTGEPGPDGTSKVYRVSGQLFFASSNDLVLRSTTTATRTRS